MALRYEWCVDANAFSNGMKVKVTDAAQNGTATLDSYLFAHTTLTSITMLTTLFGTGAGTKLEDNLESKTDAILTSNGSTVTYNAGSHTYTLASGATCSWDFRSATLGTDAGQNLAKWLGFTASHANGSGSGYNCLISGASSYTSNVRPYGILVPYVAGRSDIMDEYEGEAMVEEAVADDGTAYLVGKGDPDDGSVVSFVDWVQTAESNTVPGTIATLWTPVYVRAESGVAAWSYQRAFRWSRVGGAYPFLVVDGSSSSVHQLRADGGSFAPQRFGAKDFDQWSIPFKTRLLGRL